MTDDWIYPDEMYALPDNAKTFGEKISASRKRYIRDDLCAAQIAAAYERAADRYAENDTDEWDYFGKAFDAIRAMTPDDARAALDRMLAEARREGWEAAQEAAVLELGKVAEIPDHPHPHHDQAYSRGHYAACIGGAAVIRAMLYDKETKE